MSASPRYSRAGAGSLARSACASWTSRKTAGTKNSVATVEQIRPPITARPSGAFSSALSAIGVMPMIIASAVISTGRNRVKPASIAAVSGVGALGQSLAREADDENAVGGRDAHAHDRAGQGRHRQRRAGDEQHPDDARERGRQGADDDERIEPGLKIDDDQQIDQHDRRARCRRRAAGRRRSSSAVCPRMTTLEPCGTSFAVSSRIRWMSADTAPRSRSLLVA